MPRRSVRQRRRHRGSLSAMIGALAVLAAVLAVAFIITNWLDENRAMDVASVRETDGNYLDPNDPESQDYQLVLNADTFSDSGAHASGVVTNSPTPSPTPDPTPTPSPTPEPTYNPEDPYALVRPTAQGEGYLPIFEKANTEEKKIAITVDECSGATITANFAKVAQRFNAKLTLFPTGENIMKTGMANVLKECVYTLGFEIENRCYSDTARLYQLNDTMMAMEIWKQNIALSYVLGVKYEPHFLRTYGNNGTEDARTHAYLIQEGYLGFAGWTVSGTDTALDQIANTLAPGNIYYFKSNNDDLQRMYLLMEAAQAQGYEMVTLNELFGYEENEYYETEDSILSETLPELTDYDGAYYTLRNGDCAWAVMRMQSRLVELGYLPAGSADGIFGEATGEALCLFQAACGMAATGVANEETQERLFAGDAPANSSG